MKPKQRERAVRCLKYYGDIFEIRTIAGMDKKCREVNKRVKEMERRKRDEDKRAEKKVLRILRQAKKEANKNYKPKH